MKVYIARDLDETLCIYKRKPKKDRECGIWYDGLYYIMLNDLDIDFSEFKDVKWTDDEPVEFELKRVTL